MTRSDVKALIRRLDKPALLGLGAVALLGAMRAFALEPRLEEVGELAGRILLIVAAGWAVFEAGDAFWGRRLARLELDVADNLRARQIATRLKVLRRIWGVLIAALTLAAALTAIPWARQIGISLFASAGIAGIVIGIAARPVLSNLIAGLQIAFTQPMRLDDAVVVEGEWGWIEEIGLFHVVVRIWDWRRLVVPLTYFIEQPFQNWTHKTAGIIGTVTWRLDYRAPVPAMRDKLDEILAGTDLWDGEVKVLQVTEADDRTITLRALASARNSPEAWDLRCHIREQMIAWLQEAAPQALPRIRAEAELGEAGGGGAADRGRPMAPPPGGAQEEPAHDPSLIDPKDEV